MSHWRTSDYLIGLLAGLMIFSVWGGILPEGSKTVQNPGGDFLQFYTAGLVANRGEVDRLYDQMYFRALQKPWKEDGLFSLYPPQMALVMAPLARLPLERAILVWWAIQVVCLLASGWMLYRMMSLPTRWRVIAMMALASLFPVAIAIRVGHLAPVLLLMLVGGIYLHRKDRFMAAGLVLSLLAIKPQLAVGVGLWLLVRRDVRTLLGMAAGGAVQALIVSAAFGPAILFDYVHNLPVFTAISRLLFRYSAVFEQSLPGIVDNILWLHNTDRDTRLIALPLVHILTASAAAVLMFLVVSVNRPWSRRGAASEPPAWTRDCEYAAAVLFVLLFTPYLLIYDLTLMALPLALLWSTPKWRAGVALYATMTVAASAVYIVTAFSLTALVALWVLLAMAVAMQGQKGRSGEAVAAA